MPVAITLDLLMWMSAVTFIALSWLFNAGFVYQCGESRAYCAPYWITWRISIASQAIMGIITVIHFTLFIRDIMALRRAKRVAAKNFTELAENSTAA
ncbi:hypothetical protein FIBSPDRAFT_854974 [Athelia psychrophila]|uniref:Uncharacterized protein n=1 Tax=Athelia psychrophila TaxID=1759441 RepID=A0A166PQF4_9AGAM|nr:hypothetical protein FIBSPDRAFT_854974 [Fibularhizoctonia sp. CBS 109695]